MLIAEWEANDEKQPKEVSMHSSFLRGVIIFPLQKAMLFQSDGKFSARLSRAMSTIFDRLDLDMDGVCFANILQDDLTNIVGD